MLPKFALSALVLFAASPAGAGVQAPPPPPPPPAPVMAPPPPPPPAPPPVPGKMPHLRLYAGGGVTNTLFNESGQNFFLGVQGYMDLFLPILQLYGGTELQVVTLGSTLLPMLGTDVGVRVTPFSDWPIRPYARGNVGLAFILVLPVPSVGVTVGAALPILNFVFLDVAVGVRRAFNVFDSLQPVDFGQVELSVGF